MTMDAYSSKLRLNPEHKAFIKDLTNVLISYTPISGIFDTVKFSHKWIGTRRIAHRVATHIMVESRRSFIKSHSRKISEKYRRLGRKYHLDSNESFQIIAKVADAD
jgi:hypothetical protein